MSVPTGEGGGIWDLDEQDIPSVSIPRNQTEVEDELEEEQELAPPTTTPTDQVLTNEAPEEAEDAYP